MQTFLVMTFIFVRVTSVSLLDKHEAGFIINLK